MFLQGVLTGNATKHCMIGKCIATVFNWQQCTNISDVSQLNVRDLNSHNMVLHDSNCCLISSILGGIAKVKRVVGTWGAYGEHRGDTGGYRGD